jgi:uncharacterized protein
MPARPHRVGQRQVSAARLTPAADRSDASPVPVSCRLAVRVLPNAPCDVAVGWINNALKVKVRAPALDGRANAALCEFMAGKLNLPKSAVALVLGAKSRQKVVEIRGLTLAEVRSRLGAYA